MSCEKHDPPPVEVDGGAPAPEEVARVVKEGEAVAGALMKTLGAQLKAALEQGGPVAAIEVCQQVAMPLTDSAAGGRTDVAIGRITDRPRNPKNAASVSDRAVLAELKSALSEGSTEPVIRWESERASYYKPLVIQEVCLNCHGDPETFPPPLVKALATHYPDDAATGYELGELRGAIRVDIDRN